MHWQKKSYWSRYPENHLGALKGAVSLYPKTLKEYRKPPQKKWNQDVKSFYYVGTHNEQNNVLTHIAKATKENVLEYSLLKNGKKWIIVDGKEKASCRLAKQENTIELYLIGVMDYPNLNWGNYEHNFLSEGLYSGEVEMQLNP